MATVTIFKQTVVPIVNYLKCFNYGSRKEHSYEVRRFRTIAQDKLEETQRIQRVPPGQESNNCPKSNVPASFINSVKPVRFYPEPSMHRLACPEFAKTRFHSANESPENPVIGDSSWAQRLLGGYRWYSQQTDNESIKDKVAKLKGYIDDNRDFKKEKVKLLD